MIRPRKLSISFVLAALAMACPSDNDQQVCDPEATRACQCPGGVESVESCADDGSGWGACQCPGNQDSALPADMSVTPDSTDADTGGLPEGNTGIAAQYPGDVGIASDPAVIFADDFEGHASASDLTSKWDVVDHSAQVRIATEAGNVFRGAKALELTVPQQNQEMSNTAAKVLAQERDVLFLRYHSKFDASFDVVGSSHNGGGISAHYYVNGQATPGVPADGTNKFLALYENWRGEASTPSPGNLNVYVYHPEQRSQWGDHFFPTGVVTPYSPQPFDFGPDFTVRPDIVPELGRWYSYELMVKANTVGQLDGRIACWLDGALIADFPNLRLRDIDTLKIDRFSISLHIGSNTAGETKKWYDNVVAATSYIGPVVDS
jgi:hypothetical protein